MTNTRKFTSRLGQHVYERARADGIYPPSRARIQRTQHCSVIGEELEDGIDAFGPERREPRDLDMPNRLIIYYGETLLRILYVWDDGDRDFVDYAPASDDLPALPESAVRYRGRLWVPENELADRPIRTWGDLSPAERRVRRAAWQPAISTIMENMFFLLQAAYFNYDVTIDDVVAYFQAFGGIYAHSLHDPSEFTDPE